MTSQTVIDTISGSASRRPAISTRSLITDIPFTALTIFASGETSFVHCRAANDCEARLKAIRLAAEASTKAQKYEMRGDNDDEEARRSTLWDRAVDSLIDSAVHVRLWVGHFDVVPACPAIGEI